MTAIGAAPALRWPRGYGVRAAAALARAAAAGIRARVRYADGSEVEGYVGREAGGDHGVLIPRAGLAYGVRPPAGRVVAVGPANAKRGGPWYVARGEEAG